MLNIIHADFSDRKNIMVEPRYRYDYGQYLLIKGLDLPNSYEVHFANKGSDLVIPQLNDGDLVRVPDELMATGLPILAWVFWHETALDGETVYMATIPIIDRPKPIDYDPEDVNIIAQAVEALNRKVDSIEDAWRYAEAAQASAVASESWAVGGTDSRPGEDTDNAMYYYGEAFASASAASGSASSASGSATTAESWAVGGTSSRTGEDTDNASYYATQAANSASAAAASAAAAAERAYGVEVSGTTLVFSVPTSEG